MKESETQRGSVVTNIGADLKRTGPSFLTQSGKGRKDRKGSDGCSWMGLCLVKSRKYARTFNVGHRSSGKVIPSVFPACLFADYRKQGSMLLSKRHWHES
jgi:hypothetical protein